MPAPDHYLTHLKQTVALALDEDIGDGDITALLIPAQQVANAYVIAREPAIVCGQDWVDETFRQVDANLQVNWKIEDGQRAKNNQTLFEVHGCARSILTAERTALNFLQTLSGTATVAAEYAAIVSDAPIKILDTRKTIPGLRLAQKYATKIGGCGNHRIGLFDAFLIKENHIAACGGIARAVEQARKIRPNVPVEVEVESMDEVQQALTAGVDIIMLDNFALEQRLAATQLIGNRATVEVSGGIEPGHINVAELSGVNHVSSGAITKHLRAIDLSMRFRHTPQI